MTVSRRTTIITGATGGLGRAFVARFAALGDRLILLDLEQAACDDLARQVGNDSLGWAFDLADPEAIQRFWNWCDDQVGPPDVLLNNAGVGPSMQPTLQTATSDFARVIAVNLAAPVMMQAEAVARMKPGSVVINTASLAGLVPNPRRNAYGAAKAAIVDLTARSAPALAQKGIRVCGVAPGYVLTDMVATLARDGNIDLGAVRRRIPLGRLARPDEIASVVAFLASDAAVGCMGQTLAVDGGWSSFNMGGDACPNAQPSPAAEISPPSDAPGKTLVLGFGDLPTTALVDAMQAADTCSVTLGPETGAEELAMQVAAVAGAQPITSVIVLASGLADTGDDMVSLMSRDFGRIRDAVDLFAGQPGALVYVTAFGESRDTERAHLHRAGLQMLLRGMAAEFGPHDLRINMVAHVPSATGAGSADPQSITQCARFLAGNAASYMTGATINVASGADR